MGAFAMQFAGLIGSFHDAIPASRFLQVGRRQRRDIKRAGRLDVNMKRVSGCGVCLWITPVNGYRLPPSFAQRHSGVV